MLKLFFLCPDTPLRTQRPGSRIPACGPLLPLSADAAGIGRKKAIRSIFRENNLLRYAYRKKMLIFL